MKHQNKTLAVAFQCDAVAALQQRNILPHGQFTDARAHDSAFAAQQNEYCSLSRADLLVGRQIGKIEINSFRLHGKSWNHRGAMWSRRSETHHSNYSITPISSTLLLLEPAEHLRGILLKNFFFILRREPGDAFDIRPHVVVPFAGARIGLGSGAGPFGAEQTTFRTDDAEQQLQRLDVVERGVEVELLQSLIEIFAYRSDRAVASASGRLDRAPNRRRGR